MTGECPRVSVESVPLSPRREARQQLRSAAAVQDRARVDRRRLKLAHPDLSSQGGQRVDIVVKGRNVEVPDHYRQHVADKLRKVERYDEKIMSVDVELFHERNRRQS